MLLIADGGLSSLNTFDTIEAVLLTKNIDYIDGVKLDIRMSLDKKLVLSKYDDLAKFTLSNKMVHECNYEYLRKVKFPSHIFKYYIPTLEEVLTRYNKEKIIVLEIYDDNNLDSLCNNLYSILIKYPYKYFFIGKDKVLTTLKEHDFNKIGELLDDNSKITILNKINEQEEFVNDNIMLITSNPEKYHYYTNKSTK